MRELDALKEEIAVLKFWQGIAVVIVVSLAGWLGAADKSTEPLIFWLAIAGVVLLGIQVLALYGQIGRKIDKIRGGKLWKRSAPSLHSR